MLSELSSDRVALCVSQLPQLCPGEGEAHHPSSACRVDRALCFHEPPLAWSSHDHWPTFPMRNSSSEKAMTQLRRKQQTDSDWLDSGECHLLPRKRTHESQGMFLDPGKPLLTQSYCAVVRCPASGYRLPGFEPRLGDLTGGLTSLASVSSFIKWA